jgi:hypothetical protein
MSKAPTQAEELKVLLERNLEAVTPTREQGLKNWGSEAEEFEGSG